MLSSPALLALSTSFNGSTLPSASRQQVNVSSVQVQSFHCRKTERPLLLPVMARARATALAQSLKATRP